MSDLPERYKTCGRCVHDGEGNPYIPDSVCYLCKRNPDDYRFDWFEERKDEAPTHNVILEGRILLFDTVNMNQDIFPKTCKIDIPEVLPLCWEFDRCQVIGIAKVMRDDKGLIAKAETFSSNFIGVLNLSDIFTNDKNWSWRIL